jgi:alpha-1,3-rhamnosyl/mannosyltransferase
MRLALNATALLSPLTGIGQYCYHLGKELLANKHCDVDLFYGSHWSKQLQATPSKRLAQALPWLRNTVPYSYEMRRWVQSIQFSRHVKRGKGEPSFDVYHEPNYLSLPFEGPIVLSVHDLSWIRYPEMHPAKRVRAMSRYFEPSLRRADAIVTDSAFVKQEVIDVFGIASERITVVPLGVDETFVPLSANQTVRVLQNYRLSHQGYYLAVGTLEPRKNLLLVLKAYQQLPAKIRASYPLVLAGMTGWLFQDIEAMVAPLIRSGEVRQLGYIPHNDLTQLMAGALTLVYPSVYEGFGLPPLEAMACGLPVICSNASSLPEVIGDAGVLIDPYDDGRLAQVLLKITEDNAWRTQLGKRARLRSQQFSWPQCAQSTLSVYQSILPR